MVIANPSKYHLKSFLISTVLFLNFLVWPLSLIKASPNQFLLYFVPSLLTISAYYAHFQKTKIWPLFLLVLPFINPKLAPLPLLFFLIYAIIIRFSKNIIIAKSAKPQSLKLKTKYVLLIIASLFIFTFHLSEFQKQSIFYFDYEANQALIRKIYLYPNTSLARISQNKFYLYLDKIADNFFALTDPNNYFFAFHPREIVVTNQNLDKFPFPAIIFFLFGAFFLLKHPQFKFLFSIIFSSIITLSLLKNFDLTDFILFIPLSLLIIFGTKKMKDKNQFGFSLVLTLNTIFALFEISRLFFSR